MITCSTNHATPRDSLVFFPVVSGLERVGIGLLDLVLALLPRKSRLNLDLLSRCHHRCVRVRSMHRVTEEGDGYS